MLNSPDQWWDLLLRLFVAAVCGGILGFDREWRDKPAGLRTNMIVAIGAAAFTLITLRIYDAVASSHNNADPIRVVSGVIGGIGFLGAGAITRSQSSNHVEGLTTAASVWMVGALGIACGMAYYDIAIVTTLLGVVVLSALGWLTPK